MNAPLDIRRRLLGGILIAAFALVALIGLASMQGESPSTKSGSWLEFSVPPADAAQITGFVVGYFVPGDKTPASAFEVGRSQVQSPQPGVMRIPLIVSKLPAGQEYEIRLRTVIKGRHSGWSAPSGKFTVPEDGGTATVLPAVTENDANRSSPRGRPARSALTELKNNPDLDVRLRKQFPDVDVAEAAAGFATVRDLGAALFVSQNLKVPFKEIKRLTADAGNRNLRKAIAELKPGVDARVEAQRALKQSTQALRPVPQKKR